MGQSTLAELKTREEASGGDGLFPLPLVSFEEMILADDRPDYPMVSSQEIVFSGKIHKDALEQAIRQAVARHPLLGAKIERDAGNNWVWVHSDDELEIDWADSTEPIVGLHDYVDLQRNIGIKFWVRDDAESTRLYFHTHHACCDGFGGLQLIEDIFAAYQAACEGREQVGWRDLDSDLLRRRGDFDALRKEAAPHQSSRYVRIRDAIRFLFRKPTPLAVPRVPPNPNDSFTGAVSRDFGAELLRGLRRSAAAKEATVNDLLMRDLFLAIREWNEQNQSRPARWLRILMPCNLRETDFQAMPTGNRMGYSFLTRSPRDCDDEQALLRGITKETRQIRAQRRYLQWMRSLDYAKAMRVVMPWMSNVKRCFCTVVLSNLGDPGRAFSVPSLRQRGKLRLGEATVETFDARAPLRPLTHAALLVTTYDNRLFVSLACDNHHYSRDAAEAFLTVLGDRFEDSVQTSQARN